ncbi:tryptophan synthase subunit alpha [Halothiobacillus sp. DCM-1]|uniref:tryptophan synthase subunit alpha n=1 Tax=Halothiobacillus sp. DCM-1 TaxID=3112558 RepID=UPI00324BD4E0
MSRIAADFERARATGRKLLVPYITAGDPAPRHTVSLMHHLVAGGADMLEIGVPFSDPMADGSVIASAHERALAQGVTLTDVLGMVQTFRATDDKTPVILMGYQNPIEVMGIEAFAQAAALAGVDGVLTVDLPPEEADLAAPTLRSAGLDPIFLLAPTTPPERVKLVARLASGFVYYVSLKGVTGASHLDTVALAGRLSMVRTVCGLPVGVGFGIRDAETAVAAAANADAVIIGSALVGMLARVDPQDAATLNDTAQSLIHTIRTALDRVFPVA